MTDSLPAPIRPDSTSLPSHIGDRVRRRRIALGLTTAELATRATLARHPHGRRGSRRP